MKKKLSILLSFVFVCSLTISIISPMVPPPPTGIPKPPEMGAPTRQWDGIKGWFKSDNIDQIEKKFKNLKPLYKKNDLVAALKEIDKEHKIQTLSLEDFEVIEQESGKASMTLKIKERLGLIEPKVEKKPTKPKKAQKALKLQMQLMERLLKEDWNKVKKYFDGGLYKSFKGLRKDVRDNLVDVINKISKNYSDSMTKRIDGEVLNSLKSKNEKGVEEALLDFWNIDVEPVDEFCEKITNDDSHYRACVSFPKKADLEDVLKEVAYDAKRNQPFYSWDFKSMADLKTKDDIKVYVYKEKKIDSVVSKLLNYIKPGVEYNLINLSKEVRGWIDSIIKTNFKVKKALSKNKFSAQNFALLKDVKSQDEMKSAIYKILNLQETKKSKLSEKLDKSIQDFSNELKRFKNNELKSALDKNKDTLEALFKEFKSKTKIAYPVISTVNNILNSDAPPQMAYFAYRKGLNELCTKKLPKKVREFVIAALPKKLATSLQKIFNERVASKGKAKTSIDKKLRALEKDLKALSASF